MTRSQSDRERQLVERAHAVLPGGNLGNVAKDIVIERGEGATFGMPAATSTLITFWAQVRCLSGTATRRLST